jgi:hypothetical protein
MNDLYYSENEASLRKFLVGELIKQFDHVEVKRDRVERTQFAIDPSAIADVQLARHFSKKHAT